MTIALALAIPWFSAVALIALDGRRAWVARLATAALAATFVAVAVLAAVVWTDGTQAFVTGGWPAGIGIVLRADALGVVFALLSVGVLLVALVHEQLVGVRSPRFPALVLFMATGLTGLFLTGDIFNFYVFFEIAMIVAYVLTGYGGEVRQTGAAFIFTVVNLLGSFLFLIAVAATYHVTGTLEMAAIAERIGQVEEGAAILIAVTFFIAFGVKLGFFPFHFWLPIAYCGARPAVAAILSGALANIGTYGVLRFGGELLPRELEIGATALMAIGAVTILYGALQAMSRRSPAEVVAYSSIGQIGYVLLAVAIGGPIGFAAAVLYAIVNALSKTLLFLTIELRGWLVGGAFAIACFSVAGIPPAAGFLGKLQVLHAAIGDGSAVLVALVVLGGALSIVYMFQIYQSEYWRPRPEATTARSLPLRKVPVFAVAGLILALGLWPEPLLAASRAAAAILSGGAP